MIARNTTVPAKKTNTFTNAVDNQPSATINVTQGERQFSKDNKSLGMFNIELPPKRRGEAQIEVTFDIDANGILHVSAKELSTGKEQKVTIQGATGISDEEITAAKADAERFAEEDTRRRESVEARNKLETTIYQMERMVEDNKDKLPETEQDVIKTLISDATTVKNNADASKDEIEAMITKMEAELQTMMGKFQATDNTSHASPADMVEPKSSYAPAGEVIDAE
jgi:molecular chaperone DnaK